MKNLDTIREQMKSVSHKIVDAINAGNEDAITQAFRDYNKMIIDTYSDENNRILREQLDNSVITARGIRRITSEERMYAESLIKAASSEVPKMALTDVPKGLPTTIIDTVVEYIKNDHPLLDAIDFTATEFNIRRLYSESGVTAAVWGAVTAKIVTEISMTIKAMDSTQNKLSAFLPVPKAYLNYSPEWLVNLIISVLSESLGAGMENGIINGTGKDQPIGMIKDLDGSVTQGVYPDKTPVSLTAITPAEYCGIIADIAEKPDGSSRNVTQVIFVCNPVDYLQKVCPATTVLTSDGRYVNDIFPFPTRVITSDQVATGKAILGIADRYLATLGTAKTGVIEYDDSVQFLDDNRIYTIKAYANGTPKDNNAFVYLDISGLEPKEWRMQLVNADDSAAG